ncbi:MAG: hypothetical protein ACJ71P_01970, partial [Nitrososphaeraceae archaeon]
KLLDSFFFENQVWGALHKAWKGYVIAKNKDEYEKMEHYARIIQESQHDLGLEVSSFPNIGKSALAFYSLRAAQIVQKNNSNSGNNNNDHNHTGNANQEQISEEYLTDNDHIDQYEQECLTDDNAYSEYFRDDYNEADRFTL